MKHKIIIFYKFSVTDGLFELRAQTNGNITRVIYFFFRGDKAVLTHGFIKKTPKIPPREKERAQKIRKDYLRRNE